MIFQPIQLDTTKTKRNSDWLMVCPKCQHERIISYCQAWNISKNICQKECQKCRKRTVNLRFLEFTRTPENQKKAIQNRTGIKRDKVKKMLEYSYLFGVNFVTKEGRENSRQAKLGRYGVLSNRWEGGKSAQNELERRQDRYKQLRKEVLIRDNYTCQLCSIRGGKLEMDHIKEWCNYPELRFEITNCRTLCHDCHTKTDNYQSKAIKKRIE